MTTEIARLESKNWQMIAEIAGLDTENWQMIAEISGLDIENWQMIAGRDQSQDQNMKRKIKSAKVL